MTSPDAWYDPPKPPGELITAFFQALEPHLQPYNDLDLLSRRTHRAILPAQPLVRDLRQKLPDLYHPFAKALVQWRESTHIPSRLEFEEEIIFHLLFDNPAVELDDWTHRIYADLYAPGKHDCTFNVNSEEKPVCSNLIQWCHVIAETLLDGPFQHLGILPPEKHLVELTTGDSRDLRKQGIYGYYSSRPTYDELGLITHGLIVLTNENVPPFYRIGLIAHELLHAALGATVAEVNSMQNFDHGEAFDKAARALDFGNTADSASPPNPEDNADAANIVDEDDPPVWALDAHDEAGTMPVHTRTPAEERRRGSTRFVRTGPGTYLLNLRQYPMLPNSNPATAL